MKTDPNYIIKGPVLSEETTIQTNENNQYTFRVDPRANKRQIKEAVEAVFNVKVLAVNTMNYRGKVSGRRGRSIPGRRTSWKKAVCTLREGDSIDLI